MRSTPLDLVRAGLSALSGQDPTGWTDEQVSTTLPSLLTAFNQLTTVLAQVVGTFDTRDLAQADGLRGTRTWLTAFGRMTQGSATAWLDRARVLRQLPTLADTAATGTVPADALRPVADLIGELGAAAVTPFDQILADLAAHGSPRDVQTACQRIHAHTDPDGPDPDPNNLLERRQLTLARSGSMLAIRGQLDPAGGAAVMTALDALMRPPAPGDDSTAAQRRADALTELATRALTTADLPTVQGERPHLAILITPTALTGTGAQATTDPIPDPATTSAGGAPDLLTAAGVPALPEQAWLSWLGDVPTTVAQRLACDSTVWRTVLDPASGLPLDLGRTRRIVPHWIRKALHARDRGCRWPGCTTPTAWTDSHHLIPWYLGGQTNADNLLTLCRWHHTLVHEGQWNLRLEHHTGHVHITRPDGRPYELGPSRPWTTPTQHTGDPPPGRAA